MTRKHWPLTPADVVLASHATTGELMRGSNSDQSSGPRSIGSVGSGRPVVADSLVKAPGPMRLAVQPMLASSTLNVIVRPVSAAFAVA